MQLSIRCHHDSCRGKISIETKQVGEATGDCPACGTTTTVTIDEKLMRGDVDRCAACGGAEFFIRKDFPQKLGLGLVIAFGLSASVFYYLEHVLATFGVLAALVAVDAAIYLLVGRVTVCYRCRAEYRGVAYNPDHHGFDLATSEKYDPAAVRAERS